MTIRPRWIQTNQVTTPLDYNANPERYRLGMRMVDMHLTGSRSLYDRIADVLVDAKVRLVLDVGCGEGALCAALSGAALPRIIGLDLSATMLRAQGSGPVVRADARTLPFAAGVFDTVVTVNMLYHLADPAAAIREAHRVLAPGGLFVAATPSRRDSPELTRIWRPEPSKFDAEEAPGLVASVFGPVEVERWDAPLIRLPECDAVRDYLIVRYVAPEAAVAAAARVEVPLTVTKRGAVVYARAKRADVP
jgi:SAM-dependent methyltransferase